MWGIEEIPSTKMDAINKIDAIEECIEKKIDLLGVHLKDAEGQVATAHKEMNKHSAVDKDFPLVMRVKGLVDNYAALAKLVPEQKPQRHDALYDQLRDLIPIANTMGCYDAADYIKQVVEASTRRS